MESLITQVVTGNIGIGIMFVILWKSGFLKYLLEQKNGNGKGSADHSSGKEIEAQLKLLQENHLEHLKDSMVELKSCQKEAISILREFREYGIKIRK